MSNLQDAFMGLGLGSIFTTESSSCVAMLGKVVWLLLFRVLGVPSLLSFNFHIAAIPLISGLSAVSTGPHGRCISIDIF